MSYEIVITDVPDRESIVYEIWDENKHIAEVYMKNNQTYLEVYCIDKKLELDCNKFLSVLKKISDDLSSC